MRENPGSPRNRTGGDPGFARRSTALPPAPNRPNVLASPCGAARFGLDGTDGSPDPARSCRAAHRRRCPAAQPVPGRDSLSVILSGWWSSACRSAGGSRRASAQRRSREPACGSRRACGRASRRGSPSATSSAASTGSPRATSARASSSTTNAACPSFRCTSASSIPNAASARTPPTPAARIARGA